jgi:hypothetical protein
VGRSGGLASLWSDNVDIDIQNFSQRHINGSIIFLGDDPPWKLIGFCGHSDLSKRHEAWALLRHLKHLQLDSWVCLGDFNEIASLSKKVGGSRRLSR